MVSALVSVIPGGSNDFEVLVECLFASDGASVCEESRGSTGPTCRRCGRATRMARPWFPLILHMFSRLGAGTSLVATHSDVPLVRPSIAHFRPGATVTDQSQSLGLEILGLR